MRWHATWPVLAALLFLTGPARAQNREILDLLPAQTLACVEVRQPDRLSREVLALVKGSAIEDLPATLARFRARLGEEMPFWLMGSLGEFTMFLSPELIGEAGRMQGGAVALTGIARDGTPQIIGFLQAGDSHLPSFYMRAYMTFSNVLAIGEVEGVTLYRDRRRDWGKKGFVQPGMPPQQPEWVDSGPVMAQLPGLLVFGSTVDSVKDAVRRYKGKSAEPTLSSVRAYREAGALRERPGLFAYVDVEALAGQIEEAVKKQPAQAAVWNLWKAVLNPEALRNLTASLTLHNGNLELQARLRLDGQKKSPLLELLPEKAAKLELLHYAPRNTLVSLTLDLGDGEQRWQKITQLMDAVAKVGGQSDLNLPSKGLKELEEKMNLRIGKDLFGRAAGAALVLVPGEKTGEMLPVLVVEGTEAAAAQFLQEKLPLLLSLGEEVAKPVRVEVDGLEVFSLPAQGLLPGRKSLHYGRRGKMLVLGGTSASVAAVARKDGLLAREKVAVALKDVDSPIVVGVASVGQLLVGTIQSLGMINEPRFEKVKPIRKDGEPPPKVEKPRPPKVADKVMQEVNEAVANLAPLLLTVQRQKGELTLQVRQPSIRTLSVKLIDLWVETMLESFRERAKGKGGIGAFGEVGRAVEAAAIDAERAAKAKEAQRAAEEARRKAEEERRKRERDGKP